MDAETLEIARRLVACPKWVWSQGMTVTDGGGERGIVRAVFGDGRIDLVTIGRVPEITGGFWPGPDTIPDLDDDLTRLGVIEVMQRAWGAPYSYPEPVESFDSDGVTAGVYWRVRVPGRKFEGDTELAALLAALEAAPHG